MGGQSKEIVAKTKGKSEWLFRSIFIILIVLLILAAGIVIAVLVIPNLGVNVGMGFIRKAFFTDSGMTKGPMVQLIGSNKALIVWESSHTEPMIIKMSNSYERKLKRQSPGQDPLNENGIFKAIVDVKPGNTQFELRPANDKIRSIRKFTMKIPTFEKHLRIAVLGDNQYGTNTFSGILPKIAGEKPDVFLHVGDMVQLPWEDGNWKNQFFDPLKQSGLMRSIPFIITQGNHDVWEDQHGKNQVAPYFADLKSLSTKATGYYYSLRIGKVKFIVLDGNTEDEAQIKWLESELKGEESAEADYRIVSVHIPPFIEYWDPKTWKRGEWNWPVYIRSKGVPLFEKYNVDLVVSGHQHNYQRGSHKGVTYIVTGGGGGALDNERVEDFGYYKKTAIEHHYTLLDVFQSNITITMKLANGTIGDRLVLKKK